MGTYYVYGHYVAGEDTPFYVGKGRKRRLTDERRNIVWHRIVKKHDGYTVKILETIEDGDDQKADDLALQQEILYIAKYNPRANLTSGGEKGYVWKDEAKKTLSDTLKEQRNTVEWREGASERRGAKPFRVYFKKLGESVEKYVGTWKGHGLCADDLQLDHRHLSACLQGNRQSHHGHRFEVIMDKLTEDEIPKEIETGVVRRNGSSFKVYKNLVEKIYLGVWVNSKEFCELHDGVTDRCIRKCINGTGKKAGIFSFEVLSYTDEEVLAHPDLKGDRQRTLQAMYQKAKPFKAYENRPLGESLIGEWSNATECATALGLGRSKVSKCLRGEAPAHKGYRFEFN